MKVNGVGANTNFKGYTNAIGTGVVFPDNSIVEYVSVSLNDEGSKDYTEFRKINEMRNVGADLSDNHLTFFNYIDPYNRSNVFVNDISIRTADELMELEDSIGKKISQAEYSNLQKIQMKTYTLLASLTKRLMNDNSSIKDSSMNVLTMRTLMTIFNITKNIDVSKEMILMGKEGEVPYQFVAKRLNDMILSNMGKFFNARAL